MEWIRQSTAVVKQFGPFLDKTDGVTLKTGLVSALDHVSTGIMLSKNGGTLAVRHATVTASVYDAHGLYKVTLDTTDTGTLGKLKMIYTDPTTCLPVWMEFMVVPAMIYDAIILGSDRLDVNVTHIADTAQTARDVGASLPAAAPGSSGGLPRVSDLSTEGDLIAAMDADPPGVNIKQVNDVTVTGTGAPGNEWGP